MRRWPSRVLTVFVVATLLNFLWEIAQMPFYAGDASFLHASVHCILPSVGDGLIILLIFFAGWIVLGRENWIEHPHLSGYLLLLGTGFTVATCIEWVGAFVLDRWRYNASMPIIPLLGIGAIPVLQMLILPFVVFRLSDWWLKKMGFIASASAD